MEAIKKLRDKGIFNSQSIVESMIQKNWFGEPVIKDGKSYKIKYLNVLTVDGQEPNELAAVYGLGPKTARFKRRSTE